MAEQRKPSSTAEREMVISRVIDAPRELVFEAWTDPKHLNEWWGPNGFTNTYEQFNFKPGGLVKFVMHGPDGTDYPNWIMYEEIVRPERLVYSHGGKVGDPAEFHTTVTFVAEGNKTKVTLRALFPTAEILKKVVKEHNAVEGGQQTLARLAEHVATMSTATPNREFVIKRTFDAPRDLVWKAWTERDRLMEWFGPKGFTMSTAKLDFRPGGVFHYCLHSPEGQEMWGKFVYREIVPQEKIVLVNSFSDKDGGISRHPMNAAWPLELLTTTTFEEQNGKTTITLRWAPLNASDAERNAFDAVLDGMTMGWTGTFEQLTAYLAKAQSKV